MAVQPQAECKLHQRCHINGKGLTRFGSKFPQKTVAALASSSVVLVIDDGGIKRPASGTLIWGNVVLCAAHSVEQYTPEQIMKNVKITIGYEYTAGTAPAGDASQYEKQKADWEKGTLLASEPQARVVAVLEMGGREAIDYALLAIEWINTKEGWGSQLVTLPRFVDIARPGTGLTSELLLIGHPWGTENFQGGGTQACVGKLTFQMASHPASYEGTEFGYASFSALAGFSGGGVFNEKGELVGVLQGARLTQKSRNDAIGPCFLDLGRAAAALMKEGKGKGQRLSRWLAGRSPLLAEDPDQKVVFKT